MIIVLTVLHSDNRFYTSMYILIFLIIINIIKMLTLLLNVRYCTSLIRGFHTSSVTLLEKFEEPLINESLDSLIEVLLNLIEMAVL